jgi:hypothetical protein
MFKLVALLYFVLFGEPLLNNNYFLSMHLNLKSFSNSSIIFFYLLYEWTIFLKIKNIVLIFVALHNVFFPILFYLINLICVSISIIFCLNKKDILIKTFSKHYRVYVSSFEIKYFDVYLSLDFSGFAFRYR